MHEKQQVVSDAFSLSGSIAVVTGGGSGLGYAMAVALRAAGAQVIIVGRRRHVLEQAAAEIGPGTFVFEHDVTDHSRAGVLMEQISQTIGTPTILVNSAGVHLKKSVCMTTRDELDSVLDTHIGGAFSMTQAAIPGMRRKGYGSILFIASMTSLIGMPNVVAYSAAKAAYLGIVRTLACELGPDNIRVNAIAPGWIDTTMLHAALDGDPPRRAKVLSRTPLGRFGLPMEIGWTAVFLSSPSASFINGIVLPVDGGASVGF